MTADFKASELAVKSEYPEYWQGDPGPNQGRHDALVKFAIEDWFTIFIVDFYPLKNGDLPIKITIYS